MKNMETSTQQPNNMETTINQSNTISRRHYKNLVVVSSLSFLFILTSSSSAKVVGVDDGSSLMLQRLPLSSALLGILLGMFLVKSSLVAVLGYKFSLTLSIIGIVLFLLFHFQPTLPLLTIAALIKGFCWLILSVSISSYVTQLAYERSAMKAKNQQTTSRYLAVPYFFFKLSELGMQAFYGVLYTKKGLSPNISGGNNTSFNTTTPYQQCPPYFARTDNSAHLNVSTIDPSLNNIIIGASGAICCFAIAAIYHVVDSKDSFYHCEARTRSLRYNLVSSLYLLKNKTLLLMLPTSFYLGMAQAFIYYKSLKMAFFCNDSSLEFSVSVYIVTCCISSLVYHATIPKNIHSRHIVPAVLLLHSLVLVSMLLNASLPKFFSFVEATVFGVCDPLLFCHVKGAYGTLYESKVESTYALFEAAQHVGFYLFHVLLALTNGYEQMIVLLVVEGVSAVTFFYSIKVTERKGKLHRFDIPYFL